MGTLDRSFRSSETTATSSATTGSRMATTSSSSPTCCSSRWPTSRRSRPGAWGAACTGV